MFIGVQRSLVFCVLLFRVWNALWCFVVYTLLILSSFFVVLYLPCFPLYILFSAYLKLSLIYALCYCRILCYIFYRYGNCYGIVLYISGCVNRSGIVKSCVICFCVWNALWYFGISCYIFSICVEFILYAS